MHLAYVAMTLISTSFCGLLVLSYRTAKARAMVRKARAAQLRPSEKE